VLREQCFQDFSLINPLPPPPLPRPPLPFASMSSSAIASSLLFCFSSLVFLFYLKQGSFVFSRALPNSPPTFPVARDFFFFCFSLEDIPLSLSIGRIPPLGPLVPSNIIWFCLCPSLPTNFTPRCPFVRVVKNAV